MTLLEVHSDPKINKFLQMEETVATLFYSYELSQTGTLANTILYGPPGYAKSQIATAFLDVMGHPAPKKHQFSAGMSIQSLIGMMKLGPLQEGKIEVNTDSSFINHRVAIFEEMYNAPKHVLAVLIDILMSGEYCVEGNVCYKSRCRYIIACTNVVPEVWAQGDEERADVFKAFNERFPFQQWVGWKTHTSLDYARLIESILKTESDEFAQMMGLAHEKGKTISPRTALIGAKAYLTHGLEALRPLKGIDSDLLFEFAKIDSEKQKARMKKDIQNVAKQLTKVKSVTLKDLHSCLTELSKHTDFDDQYLPAIAQVKHMYDQKIGELRDQHLGAIIDVGED